MVAAVSIVDVVKHFRFVEGVPAFRWISPRRVFGLLGPNGAGKTTLISSPPVWCVLIRELSRSGDVVIRDYREALRLLGVVPQELVFDPFFNVRETLRIQSGYFGIPQECDDWIDEILANLDLTSKAEVNMRRLSGGMKRRALVAQALVHNAAGHRAR